MISFNIANSIITAWQTYCTTMGWFRDATKCGTGSGNDPYGFYEYWVYNNPNDGYINMGLDAAGYYWYKQYKSDGNVLRLGFFTFSGDDGNGGYSVAYNVAMNNSLWSGSPPSAVTVYPTNNNGVPLIKPGVIRPQGKIYAMGSPVGCCGPVGPMDTPPGYQPTPPIIIYPPLNLPPPSPPPPSNTPISNTGTNTMGGVGDPHFEGFDNLFDFHGEIGKSYQLYKSKSLVINCKMWPAFHCQESGTFMGDIYIRGYKNGKEFEIEYSVRGTSDMYHVLTPLQEIDNSFLSAQAQMLSFQKEFNNDNWQNNHGMLLETDVGNIYLIHSHYLGQPHVNFKYVPTVEEPATGIIGQTRKLVRIPNKYYEIPYVEALDVCQIVAPEVQVTV